MIKQFIIAITLFGVALFGQSAEGPSGELKPAILTTGISVVNKRFCIGDPQVTVLRLTLNMTFTNPTKKNVILSKSAGSSASVTIYRMNADNPEAKPALSIIPETDLTPRALDAIDVHPDDRFVVLGPGKHYVIARTISVFTTIKGKEEVPGAIPPGRYKFFLDLATWTFAETSPDEVRQKWKQYGYLFSEPLRSEPFSVEVDDGLKPVDCK